MKTINSASQAWEVDADVAAIQLFQNDDSNFSDDKRFSTLDGKLDGHLSALCAAERFRGRPGDVLSVHTLGRVTAQTLLLIGAGKKGKSGLADDRTFAATAVRRATALRGKTLALSPVDTGVAQDKRLDTMLVAARLAGYRFDRYHTKDQKDAPQRLVSVAVLGKEWKGFEAAAEKAKRISVAIALARDLINEPANVVTPESFAKEARRVAKDARLECTVLEPKDLVREKFGMLLAVGQGSDHTPRVVHLVYKPKKKTTRKVALIGKGVTFDSGGLSLKPAQSMEDMKVDMSGGAAVLATMSVLAAAGVEVEVHGLIGLVENMPSSKSYRPGDVLTSRKGTTVEVNNTDAEGRLVLGDVIDYTNTTVKPDLMIDLATLTGACMVALGPTTAGLFSNDDGLAQALLSASKRAGEDLWRLPLNDSLKDQLKSDVADMRNTGDRMGGAITGALFLKEFVGDTLWAHMDIAGPATSNKEKGVLAKGGTGYGVATLLELLTHELPGKAGGAKSAAHTDERPSPKKKKASAKR
jgi:leucyl aminopeptidase